MKNTMRAVAGVSLGVLGAAGLARAFNPQPEPPARSDGGPGRTQTAVLNAVLVGPPDPDRPACRLDLSFVDAQGRPFHDASGGEAGKRVELRGGVADSIRLRAGDVLRDDQLRIPIRAVMSPPPDDNVPSDCTGLVATLEIVGPLGATQLLYSPPPDDGSPVPEDGQPIPDDGIVR